MPATDGLGHDLLGAVAGGGFEQCYNAQATVAAESLLVVTADVVQPASDKREIEPALAALARLPEALGTPESLLADSGYFSQANIEACADADIAPLIAQAREHHHLSWRDRFRRGAAPRPGGSNAAGGDAPSLRHAGGPAGSDRGAERTAAVYTLIETARLNYVNPAGLARGHPA